MTPFGGICGIDEAGRGPWAGPVVAAAVILPKKGRPKGLADSKTLSAEAREELAKAIRDCAMVGVGMASPAEIDEINILQATYLAMRRALAALPEAPVAILIDGNSAPADLPCAVETIIDGDAHVASISAASIIAKVHRDALMRSLSLEYPQYGFAVHKGYPTRAHLEALHLHGPASCHRASFAPVRVLLKCKATA